MIPDKIPVYPRNKHKISAIASAVLKEVGARNLAEHFGVTESTPSRWAAGIAAPSPETQRELMAFYVRLCVPAARSMLASFIPWMLQNGIPHNHRGMNALTRLILIVAGTAREGCARCINSRCRETITGANALLKRDCLFIGGAFPSCVARKLPAYLSDELIDSEV